MRMLSKNDEPDDSTEVSWEDQQNINTFSKLNARRRDIEDRISQLKMEKEGLNDLASELEELELLDEDQPVLYKIGETFLHLRPKQAQRQLRKDQAELSKELSKLVDIAENCEETMKGLKVTLYSRFGSAINLEEK